MVGITEEQYTKWVNFELVRHSIEIECRKYVPLKPSPPQTSIYIFNRCHQKRLVDREDHDAVHVIVCPDRACGYSWCKRCSQAVESGDASNHSCDGTKEFDRLMAERKWARCPVSPLFYSIDF